MGGTCPLRVEQVCGAGGCPPPSRPPRNALGPRQSVSSSGFRELGVFTVTSRGAAAAGIESDAGTVEAPRGVRAEPGGRPLRPSLSPVPPPPASVSPRSPGSAHARPGVSPPALLRALCSCHPGWPGQPAPGPGGRGPPPGASPAASWPWPCGAVASFLGPRSPLQQAFSTPAQPASVKRPVRASLVGDTKRRCRLPALPGPGASAS